MGDLGASGVTNFAESFTHLAGNTNDQELFRIQNPKTKIVAHIHLQNLTKRVRIEAEMIESLSGSFRRFYNKIFDPNDFTKGDFEANIKTAVIEFDGYGSDYKVDLQTLEAGGEPSNETITVNFKEYYAL